eukprot:517274_1
MLTALGQLRKLENTNKQKIQKIFNDYIGSDRFRNFVQQLNLQHFKFEIATPQDFDELLNLYCTEIINKKTGERGIHFLLDLNEEDLRENQKQKLKHLLNAGRLIKVSNENNTIVSMNGFIDFVHCHPPHAPQKDKLYSNNFLHFLEITDKIKERMNEVYKNDEIYQQILTIDYENNNIDNVHKIKTLYGRYFEWSSGATLVDYSKKGLMMITLSILWDVSYKLNYTHFFGLIDTPSQIRKMKMLGARGKMTSFNIDGYTFKDGTKITQYENNFSKDEIDAIQKEIFLYSQPVAIYAKLFNKNMDAMTKFYAKKK